MIKTQKSMTIDTRYQLTRILICLVLCAATIIVYWQVTGFDFITLDDPQYVSENDALRLGMGVEGIKWAFTSFYAANWHPLTWISHMIDVQLFGLNPGMHHLTSLILHLLGTIFLFMALELMTGSPYRSAAVAFLFALHPLHTESVAWVAERKDVLSGLFWMLTLAGYAWYVQHRNIRRYLVLLLFFILGILSKPMVVTLPFVLLLLDYWPLCRLSPVRDGGDAPVTVSKGAFHSTAASKALSLILEKLPLMVCAVFSAAVTLMAQGQSGAVSSLERVSLSHRMANAATSYVMYLWKTLCPVKLAVFYPYAETVNLPVIIVCSALLLLITASVVLYAARLPYLLVGWLWYLGTLVPVIGIVQVGSQSMADRYTYIPLVGIFIMAVWGLADLLGRWRPGKAITGAMCTGALLLMIWLSWNQAGYWKNSETLWRHAAKVTENNYKAHTHLGFALTMNRDTDGAISEFQNSVRIKPTAEAYNALGTLYGNSGHEDEAVDSFVKGLEIEPYNVNIRNNFGILLMSLQRNPEAVGQFREALQVNPADVRAWFNLGKALLAAGNASEALAVFQDLSQMLPGNTEVMGYLEKAASMRRDMERSLSVLQEAIRSEPQNPALYVKLGELYFQQEDYHNSLTQYQKALSLQPRDISTLFRLALVYSTLNETGRALDILQEMIRIEPDNPEIYYNIACIHARRHDARTSVEWLEKAMDKGFSNYDLIRKDPDLSGIRNSPYYKDLMKNR